MHMFAGDRADQLIIDRSFSEAETLAAGPVVPFEAALERCFGLIIQPAIRRGSFRSVGDLITRIQQFIEHYTHRCRPFAWTATADSIFQKLARLCSSVAGTGQHTGEEWKRIDKRGDKYVCDDGSYGTGGGAVARNLLANGQNVRTVVRDERAVAGYRPLRVRNACR